MLQLHKYFRNASNVTQHHHNSANRQTVCDCDFLFIGSKHASTVLHSLRDIATSVYE